MSLLQLCASAAPPTHLRQPEALDRATALAMWDILPALAHFVYLAKQASLRTFPALCRVLCASPEPTLTGQKALWHATTVPPTLGQRQAAMLASGACACLVFLVLTAGRARHATLAHSSLPAVLDPA